MTTNETTNTPPAGERVSRLQTCLTLSKLASNASDAEERRAILAGLKAFAWKSLHRQRYKANKAARDAAAAVVNPPFVTPPSIQPLIAKELPLADVLAIVTHALEVLTDKIDSMAKGGEA